MNNPVTAQASRGGYRTMASLMIAKNKIENVANQAIAVSSKVSDADLYPSAIFPDPALV